MNVVIHNTIFIKSKKFTEGGHGTYSVGTWLYQVWRLWKQQRKSLMWPLGLVAQAGMFELLDSASGTPSNKTWIDRFMSPSVQNHCATANRYAISHIFYTSVCMYMYLSLEPQRYRELFFPSYFFQMKKHSCLQSFWSTPGKDREIDRLQIQLNNKLFPFLSISFAFSHTKVFWFDACSRGGSKWNGK